MVVIKMEHVLDVSMDIMAHNAKRNVQWIVLLAAIVKKVIVLMVV